MKRKAALAVLALAIMLAMGAWFISGLSSFARESAAFTPPSSPQKLDAVVVLTGGSNRLDTGFDLLQKGLGKKLFISGVYRGLEVKQLLKRWKDEPQSHLDCCVVLGFAADNTVGNAAETAEWMRREGYHSFYLVTSNYHIKRALLEFTSIAPNLSLVPFPVTPNKIDLNVWWLDPATQSLVLREYTKYLAVRLRHSITG